MKSGSHTKSVVIPLALLGSFPFIQWGASPYLSVQMLCFLILLSVIDYKKVAINITMFVFVALATIASTLAFTESPLFLHSMLRVGREGLCLFVLLSIYSTHPKFPSNDRPIRMVVAWLVLTMLISTVLQYYFYNYRSSTMFFVPSRFYTGVFGTFADNWAAFAQEHALTIKIRPSSFYAEPSYLGFISLSLLVIVLKVFQEGIRKYALIITLLAALAMSQTLSGLMSFCLLLGAFYFKEFKRIHPFIVVELLLLVPVYFLLYSVPEIFLRLLDIGDPNKELSGYIRLVLPFELIGKVLAHSPLGVPQDQLLDFLRQPSVDAEAYMFSSSYFGLQVSGLDNAFLNFFIYYGMLGIVVIWAFVRQIQDRFLLFYLFLTSIFNGALLSYDKVAVISSVFLIIGHWHRRGAEAASEEAISARRPQGYGLLKTGR
jgi:hypothetical protein